MIGHFMAHSTDADGILCMMFNKCEKSLIERAAHELEVSSERLR